MGIHGLWDVLGDGEIVHIADYAARHFERHKRPLRVAVDEACWRFTNLTPDQVEKIRDGEPSANPVEKTILWRVLRLMKLNVQLIFVYDGLRKPWKRDKSGGSRLDKELIRLLHQLFDHLKIPYHQAPGEAEAECAALQQRGIVDAVWSDDGDAFMFGCRTLIKQHKVGKDRVKDYIKVYEADIIEQKLDFDRHSFVLFAVLAGGDYSTQGLRGCGPQLAKLLAKRQYSIASSACTVQKAQLPQWRADLLATMKICGKGVEMPSDFPDFKALGHYRDPAISTPKELDNLRGLRQGWERPIDQIKLCVLLRNRFNLWTRGFLKHIIPVFLSRALANATTPDQIAENMQYAVQFKRTRKPKEGDEAPAKAEVKVTFSPLPAVQINLGQQPPEEDWSLWANKDGTLYDPAQSIECEVLDCLLRNGLPEGGVAAPEALKRKRKADSTPDGASPARKATKRTGIIATEEGSPPSASSKSHTKTTKDAAATAATAAPRAPRKRSKTASTVETPPKSPPATFKLPTSYIPPVLLSSPVSQTHVLQPVVFTIDDSSDESEPEADIRGFKVVEPHRSSIMNSPPSPLFMPPIRPAAAEPLIPGQSIAPSVLRDLRAASTLFRGPTELIKEPAQVQVAPQTRRAVLPPAREVIDLT